MLYRILNIAIIFILSISTILGDTPDWDCDGDELLDNLGSYQFSGSITSAAFIDEINVGSSEEDLLGAFIGEELRGIGIPTAVPFGPYAGTYQFFTLIYSNSSSGETVTFKFDDSETDAVYDITETYDYVSDMTHGNVMSPELLNS